MARENAEKIDKSIKENEDLVRQIDEESRNYDIEQYDVTKVNGIPGNILRWGFDPPLATKIVSVILWNEDASTRSWTIKKGKFN